jgi:hypothetical protein
MPRGQVRPPRARSAKNQSDRTQASRRDGLTALAYGRGDGKKWQTSDKKVEMRTTMRLWRSRVVTYFATLGMSIESTLVSMRIAQTAPRHHRAAGHARGCPSS